MRESVRAGGYYWSRFLLLLHRGLRLRNGSAGLPAQVAWPREANFAVSGQMLRRQPLWIYEVLVRLVTTEHRCMATRSIAWAHTMERTWLDVLNGGVGASPDDLPECLRESA